MRPEKQMMVDDLSGQLRGIPFVLVTDYSGMKVEHFSELRTRLAGVQAEFRVVKNTLMRRALKECELPELGEDLTGQTAVVLGDSDVSAAAKILKTFAKEFDKPSLRAGILDTGVLSADQVNDLAELPTLDVMRAKFLGLLQTPASQLVRVLNAPAQGFATVLKAKIDKSEG